jgi:hypothetical protein
MDRRDVKPGEVTVRFSDTIWVPKAGETNFFAQRRGERRAAEPQPKSGLEPQMDADERR